MTLSSIVPPPLTPLGTIPVSTALMMTEMKFAGILSAGGDGR